MEQFGADSRCRSLRYKDPEKGVGVSDELEQIVRNYDTPYLLEQFYVRREEYSDQALGIMEKEIARRDISDEELEPYRAESAESEPATTEQEFVKLEDTFSRTDLVLVHAMLRDARIPFYVDNPASTVVPLASGTEQRFTIHVPASEEARARELIEQHFHCEQGEYRLRHTGTRDRLRGFSFNEVGMSEAQLEQEVEVTLSPEEADGIKQLGRRLLGEIEQVEREQERVVFHFDNVEGMLERLEPGRATMSMVDLLTVMEVLQIYCDDAAFPPSLLQVAASLMEVFDTVE